MNQRSRSSVKGNVNAPIGNISGTGNQMARTSWFTRIRNDWSGKRKAACVFLSVTVVTGGATTVLVLLGPEPPAEGRSAPRSTTTPQHDRPSTDLPAVRPPEPTPTTRPVPSGSRPGNGVDRPSTTTNGGQEPQDGTTARTRQLATTADQPSGLPGTSLNFYGTGYDGCPDYGSRTVDVLWDGYGTGITAPIEPDGRFGIRFTVPESAGTGTHYLYGRCVDGGEWARTEFAVTPPLALTTSPTRGSAGTSVTVHGTEYGGCPDYGNRAVNVIWEGTGISASAPIEADGTFTVTFTVPATNPGDYYLTGQCQDGGQWTRTIFTVTP
jgi:hypothetical protein